MLPVQNIVDIILGVLIILILPLSVMKKCGLKISLFYFAVAIGFIAVQILNILFYIPILATLFEILVVISILIFAFVYINDIRSIFFHWSKVGQTLKKEDIKASDEELRVAIDEIVRACTSMSKVRTGALIVIAPGNISSHLLETGTEIGALVSSPLLESIFITKGPIHDGAVIIKGNKVIAAGCFLPLAQGAAINKTLGTRHRAGIGITEQTDMLTIIVSEENGIISVAENGELKRYITPERLSDILSDLYKVSATAKRRTVK